LDIIGKYKLLKFKKKNLGNTKLVKAIDKLLDDITLNNWRSQTELTNDRKDADCVHKDGFYFFDINVHRTLVLIVFEKNEAIIQWVGTHADYESTFKNNKKTIETWLRNRGQIK